MIKSSQNNCFSLEIQLHGDFCDFCVTWAKWYQDDIVHVSEEWNWVMLWWAFSRKMQQAATWSARQQDQDYSHNTIKTSYVCWRSECYINMNTAFKNQRQSLEKKQSNWKFISSVVSYMIMHCNKSAIMSEFRHFCNLIYFIQLELAISLSFL